MSHTRRHFLRTTAASTLLGLEAIPFLSRLRPVCAEEAKLNPSLVKLNDDIEPLVKLLEDTPRDRLLEEVASKIEKGTSYREVLAALLLAGVRNVQPRPAVGFKFHAVLVVNSAHLASLASPDSDRWLPIFWALDYFKSSQAATQKESGWRMRAVNESNVPPADKARQAFITAMDNWDEEAADVAVSSLARSASSGELFELFSRYGCRDFRDIGHKAIYVSNAFRTLESIGWQYAEPVLRSLAFALLKHDGQNPSKSDQSPDRPGRRNAQLVASINPNWKNGKPSPAATDDLLSTLRDGSEEDAAKQVAELLNSNVSPQSIWDAIFAASAELLMRQPGIVPLHSMTTSNALRYSFQSAGDDRTRLMALLQNASFVPLFRNAMRNAKPGQKINELNVEKTEGDALTDIFATAGADRAKAASKTLAHLQAAGHPNDLMSAARRLVFLKGRDSHDYKFSSAVLEDYFHLSPPWRDRYLAASMYYLPASAAKDNGLVARIRAALA